MTYWERLNDASFAELVPLFEAHPEEGSEYALAYYTDVAYAMISRFPSEGYVYLCGQIANERAERAAAALFGISQSDEREDPTPTLLVHLSDLRPVVLAEAIRGLIERPCAAATAAIGPMLSHFEAVVVNAAAAYLARADPEALHPHIDRLLHHPDAVVRMATCDLVDDLGLASEHEGALRELLDDHDPQVAATARLALECQ